MSKEKISFVIPCYRSEKTIGFVIDEIVEIMDKRPYEYEIIPVNDCSPDDVWSVLESYASDDARIKPICLAKNMNKTPALMAGFSKATGDYVVFLDDDGQCPMDKIDELIEPLLKEEADATIARYPQKKQSKFKNMGSKMNDIMLNVLIDKPKDLQVSNFVAMKRYIVDEIVKYDHSFPYFSGLLLRTTSNVKNVEMEERERSIGTSTYTFKKLLSVWMNGATAFSIKPLRISALLGFIMASGSFLWAVILVIRKLCVGDVLIGYSSIVCALLLVGGINMIILGIIGEYIGRIYICINKSPQYVIKKSINFDEK